MSSIHRAYVVVMLVMAAILQDPRLLDPFHHSRFLFASIALLIALGAVGIIYRSKRLSFNLLDALVVCFTIWSFLSVSWALNFSEAMFSSQKWLILAAGYFVGRFLVETADTGFITDMSKYSLWVTLFILAVTWWNLVQLMVDKGYSNEILYDLKVLFGHRSLIAAFLMLLLPLNLLDRKKVNNLLTPFPVVVALQILTIMVLQSRTVYLALFTFLLLTTTYLFGFRKHLINRRVAWQTGALLLVLVITAGTYLASNESAGNRLNPMNYFTSQTATERRLVWIKTMDMIRDRPVAGLGSGNWKLELPGWGTEGSYRMQDQDVVFTRAHNDFLEIWAELGLVGLLMYASILLLPLYYLWSADRKGSWNRLMIGMGIIAFIIISFIDFPRERSEFIWLLSLFLALARSYDLRKNWQWHPALLHLLIIILALGLCLNIYTGLVRYQGEVLTRKLLNVRRVENWNQVVRLADQASNKWYRLDPSTVPLDFYKGVALYNLGELNRAKETFGEARRYHPYNFHVINNQATILIQEKKYDEALPLLREALRINDRFTDALFNLAYCHFHLGEYGKALEIVDKIPGNSQRKEAYRRQIEAAQQKAGVE